MYYGCARRRTGLALCPPRSSRHSNLPSAKYHWSPLCLEDYRQTSARTFAHVKMQLMLLSSSSFLPKEGMILYQNFRKHFFLKCIFVGWGNNWFLVRIDVLTDVCKDRRLDRSPFFTYVNSYHWSRIKWRLAKKEFWPICPSTTNQLKVAMLPLWEKLWQRYYYDGIFWAIGLFLLQFIYL